MKPRVVLVGGLSGSGKTWLAQALARELGLPYLAKDVAKEALFDSLGWSDRAWSRRLSGAAHAVLNPVIEQLLEHGPGLVLDANLNPAHDQATRPGRNHPQGRHIRPALQHQLDHSRPAR